MDQELSSNAFEDDGAGYLISVSDIMAGLLFVFLITLVAFIINFQSATDKQEEKTQAAELEKLRAVREKERAQVELDSARQEKEKLESVRDDLTNARRLRQKMLDEIQARLKERGIRVEVDHDHGVLRLTESAISFGSGKAELAADELVKLEHIGAVLMEVLPCYAADAPETCDQEASGKLEAVFVEGHTDNMPFSGGRYRDNWDLSAQRAMHTYREVAGFEPAMPHLRNTLGQPLFSVSGYGEGRPVVRYMEPTPEPRNRRIDLRFIMAPPPEAVELRPVRELRERGVK